VRILIYCPVSQGGIAEHANYQACAFALYAEQEKASGWQIVLLTSQNFLAGREVKYEKAEIFAFQFPLFTSMAGRVGRLVERSLKILSNEWRLAWEVLRRKPDMVLLASYSECLAPFWIWPHWILARLFGVTYVANLHDPIRDYQIGPKCWHEISVKMAYWPISVGVVHQRLPEPSPVPNYVKVVEAPVGVYDLQESHENPAAIRAEWGIPTGAVVFLAFGYIRDNKNLNLVIRALSRIPHAHLIVMGKSQSQKDKPVEFYRKLAEEVSMSARVKFFDAFVPDEKLSSFFAAADVVLLTYDKSFHSQSGVLNVAARARRPVLASAGSSPLKDCVKKYQLGIFVEPDDEMAIIQGAQELIQCFYSSECSKSDGASAFISDALPSRPARLLPDWTGYEAYASWGVNIKKILDAVSEVKRSSSAL
jgi:glycosyltransferase involved in cell wall biosynthesis